MALTPRPASREPAASAEEERRQRAVESLHLTHDRSYEHLDRITRVARVALDVPAAAITVLDRDQAWFASVQGTDLRELPRDQTLCAQAVSGQGTLVVEDAGLDERLAALAAVAEHGVRFYAGRPILDPYGNAVAVFCVFDTVPRTLDADRLAALEDLATWAQRELLSSHEMSQAGRVQASMLPAQPIRTGPWDVGGLCLPALTVGGDFFDYAVGNDVLHLGIGDVMGKGAGAALIGAGVRAAFRGTHAAVTAGVDLGVTGTQVARALLPDLERAESFVTYFEAAIDTEDGYLRYLDAGMGLCLVLRADGSTERLAGPDRPFGVLPEDHWSEQESQLDPGDRLLMFSDGLLDLVDDEVQWDAAVADLLRDAATSTDVLSAVAALARDRTPLDDVTVVTVLRQAESS